MISTTPIVKFAGRIVIIGFGSIGQGILPLLLRHIDMKPEQISIVTAEERGHGAPVPLARPVRGVAARAATPVRPLPGFLDRHRVRRLPHP